MLHIRLSKGGGGGGGSGGASGDGGGSVVGKPTAAVETVTVACPDHLVLADLPVAKSLGTITTSTVRSVGRRARRHHGERVHFCVCCDFPIAIYGRLMPCEHAFCLSCARTDSSCYLCEERIQKIQTIKLLEEIYICGAPHCLKSFLKRSEFEAHVYGCHSNLLASNVEKDEPNETNAFNSTKPSSTDAQKQSVQPEMSTARAPPRSSGFSPSSNSQHQDNEGRTQRHQSRDPPPRAPQSFDRPYNWIPPPPRAPQSFDRPYNWIAPPPYQQNLDQPETSFPNFPPLPNQPMNYSLVPTPFPYASFPTEGESGQEQGASVLGFPQAPMAVGGFPDNLARPWGVGPMGVVPFQPIQMAQGTEGFGNVVDAQAGVAFFQGDFGRLPEGLPMNAPLLGKESDSSSLQPPLPLQPPPLLQQQQQQQQQQFNRSRDIPPGFGWQNDKRGPE